MENKKAYVVVDFSVCNYEECSNIVAVADNEETAKRILKECIRNAKIDVDFDNIDKTLEDSELGENKEAEWIYSESDTHFEIYRNGYYASDHININIEVRPYLNEITYDKYLKDKNIKNEFNIEI